MAIWLNRSGKYCEHEERYLKDGRIYLTWDNLHTDLGVCDTREKLSELLETAMPDAKTGLLRQNLGQIWAFLNKMQPGDWVCTPSKRKTIHIGEITGKYEYDPNAESPYWHRRSIKWLETDIPRTNFDQDLLHSLGAISTICQIKRNDAETRIRAMQKNNWKSAGVKLNKPVPVDDEASDEELDAGFDLEQIARDHISRLLYAKFSGHKMETLVQAILEAKGYTVHHSDKGADGGIDLLAASGNLGFGEPRICVQVKSQDSALERPVLDQLVGTMQHVGANQGLLVCWGGFKKTILAELPRLFFTVRMWGQEELIDEFLEHYDQMPDEIRSDVPLKRAWVVVEG
jgi:restriction system protein